MKSDTKVAEYMRRTYEGKTAIVLKQYNNLLFLATYGIMSKTCFLKGLRYE